MSKPQRRLRNYLIDPLSQVKLSAIVLGLMAMFEATLLIFSYYYLADFTEMLIELSDIPEDIRPQAFREIQQLFCYLVGITVFFFLITFIVVVKESHKYMGAAYATNRFVNENLAKGIYSQKLVLRKGDHMQRLAKSLNNLAETLSKEKK